MYSFRFNPVSKRWVTVGTPLLEPETVTDAHLLDVGRERTFVAASYPRHLFVLDPESGAPTVHREGVLNPPEPAVGEYELLLYCGDADFWRWRPAQWENWLTLLTHRLHELHRNRHLSYVVCRFATRALYTFRSYLRVGDLIAASHPVEGMSTLLPSALLPKIAREELFTVFAGRYGLLHVPPAPTADGEVWYVPRDPACSVTDLGKAAREELGEVLATLFSKLHEEWPQDHFTLVLHTGMAALHPAEAEKPSQREPAESWWLQIFRDAQPWQEQAGGFQVNPILPIRLAPEGFVRVLHRLFGRL